MKNNGQVSREIATMSDLPSVLAYAGRAAARVGRQSLILASLVVAATIMLPGAAFAAPVGASGASPALKPVAGKDPPISFNFNLGGYIGSGSLLGTNEGGGNYLATSGTLTMAPTSVGFAGNTYCLVKAAPPPGSVSTSPQGAFLYDDFVTPGANPAFPDIYALLFSNRSDECGMGYSGTDEINIWATDGTPGNYSFYVFTPGVGYGVALVNPAGSFTATTVTTTYSYAGHGFKLFQCVSSPGTDCSTPGAGNPYTTSDSVTVSLQVGSSLCRGSPGSCSTTPINILCSSNPASMTLNDGVNSINATNADCSDGNAQAWVATDANGTIVAWYLEANTGDGGQDIFTLYDPHTLSYPQGQIAGACNNCYGLNGNVKPNANEQDYGQFVVSQAQVYGYNLGSHGSFTPGYGGGTTTVGNCINGQTCSLVPGNTFTIKGPNAGAIPPGAVLTEQQCIVPADPRGPNCGAVNGHLPRTLAVSSLPQCAGFGNEVIPDYLCGASGGPPGGPQGTGFALILGNAEQIDTFNGTYGDSELNVEGISQLAGAPLNPACPPSGTNGRPPLLTGQPSALAAVGTRSNSLVEEQTPEMTFDGRPLLIDMTSSCDPPRSNHGPGLTLEGVGFKLRTKDPTVRGGLSDAQSLLVFANYKFFNLDIVMLLTKFPTNPATTRQQVQTCINKSQILLNTGPSHNMCAAEQLYRCDQIVEPQPDNGFFNQFGPSSSFLRLPDPYGDVVRRLGNLYYTINTRIGGNPPNNDWPLSVDPYPNQCP
jgi:hypothetical protein